jgi:dipeptidyl aminopeptidase/acylaminoacyl peptidase
MMVQPRIAPYGSWKSPISADLVATGKIGLGRIVLDGEDTYWAELRPSEQGRNIIVKRGPDGQTRDVTPEDFSVGTTVHEYGAKGYTVADGVVYFANFENQRVYRHRLGENPVPLTPPGDMRYAGMQVDRLRNRVVCVRENHELDTPEAVNRLVAIDIAAKEEVRILASGKDFYAMPKVSPDGSKLAWKSWSHPNMPWDGTRLWVAAFADDGLLQEPILVAGGVDEAVKQAEWSPDGTLYFVSDRTRWANLYRWNNGDVEPLLPMEAEFCKAHWWVGMTGFGFESASTMVYSYADRGTGYLAILHLDENRLEPVSVPYTEMVHGDLKVAPGRVVFEGGSATRPFSVLELDLATRKLTVLQVESSTDTDTGYLSAPETIEFPTENELTAHAFYYAPKNKDFTAPAGSKPPLLVICHGGPHSATSTALDLATQYWTSRGVGVVDVNYGGSTGYGRDYRERLIGDWGVVDVDDCVNAARYLIERGDVDKDRVAISGGSAGGYTTLCAMTFRDFFRAGTSYFGVSDLELLLDDIHKFDTFSLVGLVGPYPLYRQRYFERSPINFIEQINCPVLLLQGTADTIIPPDQSEQMFDRLRSSGIPTAYVTFEGEGHGFVQSENIKRAMEVELYFYSRVFGFELATPVEPVKIENME